MKITIAGTGAMALALGARLSRQHSLTLVGSWPEGLRALRQNGIRIDDGETQKTIPVKALEESREDEASDLVLILVKSWQTEAAARRTQRGLAPGGLVLTLQNGLTHVSTLENIFGAGRILVGTTTLGATLLAPGQARSLGQGLVTLSQRPQASVAAALLQEAGFNVRMAQDYASLLWSKAVINAAINPLGALFRKTNGELAADPYLKKIMAAVAGEAYHVSQARGITLPYQNAGFEAWRVAMNTAFNRSSMLQDVDHGRPTEIDAINGAIVKEGERLGIKTPLNRFLWQTIRSLSPLPIVRPNPNSYAPIKNL